MTAYNVPHFIAQSIVFNTKYDTSTNLSRSPTGAPTRRC